MRRRVPELPRGSGADAPGVARRRGGGAGRADPGRRRLRRPAGGVPSATARADQQARHAADGGRGAVGHGPHRQDVRDRALRGGAGRRHRRQGDRVGAAARRDHGARRGDGVAAGCACPTFGGNPGVVRGGERDDQAPARLAGQERGRGGRAPDGRPGGAAGQAPAHRRGARQGPDGGRGAGARPHHQGAGHDRARPGGRRSASPAAC